jgi:hypothetical protein
VLVLPYTVSNELQRACGFRLNAHASSNQTMLRKGRVTVSIGGVSVIPRNTTIAPTSSNWPKALYEAKRRGRNRFVMSGYGFPPREKEPRASRRRFRSLAASVASVNRRSNLTAGANLSAD